MELPPVKAEKVPPRLLMECESSSTGADGCRPPGEPRMTIHFLIVPQCGPDLPVSDLSSQVRGRDASPDGIRQGVRTLMMIFFFEKRF